MHYKRKHCPNMAITQWTQEIDSMGKPAWTKRRLLGVISSEELPNGKKIEIRAYWKRWPDGSSCLDIMKYVIEQGKGSGTPFQPLQHIQIPWYLSNPLKEMAIDLLEERVRRIEEGRAMSNEICSECGREKVEINGVQACAICGKELDFAMAGAFQGIRSALDELSEGSRDPGADKETERKEE